MGLKKANRIFLNDVIITTQNFQDYSKDTKHTQLGRKTAAREFNLPAIKQDFLDVNIFLLTPKNRTKFGNPAQITRVAISLFKKNC
ncbi:MAG TPA: hypothetical protein EYP74_01960 [Anaerolineales bacterium]|nr:hypothetical protein [Anaerolineales bacterium]